MIERGLVYVIRRGLAQAEKEHAKAIIFDMDTPGGKLQSAEEIVHALLELSVPTYTFVNPRAISAGAIIALATDEIYMAPAGLIGDAMPIMMSPLPLGRPQEMPDGLKEKVLSPTVALVRSAAQHKGHDPKLAEAMVRPEFEYKIGDKMISPEGQLLTLTSKDAEQLVGKDNHPLLSRGTVKNLEELLERIGRSNTQLVILEVTLTEQIARLIEGFPLSGILLALGLLGLYIEFKTPGFGLPGVMGVLLLAVWFWGHHIAGLAGTGELLLFVTGVVFLSLEVFIIPGFGIVGISGLCLMTSALIMAMVEHYPGLPWYRLPEWQIQGSIKDLGFALLIAFVLAAILARFLPKTGTFQQLMLGAAVSSEKGFQASARTENLIGNKGLAVTPLRPAGIGLFDGERMNVVARGEFIEKDRSIVIAEAHGNRIVVETDNHASVTESR